MHKLGMWDLIAALTMVLELMQQAQRTRRKLDGSRQQFELVHADRRFVEGVLQEEAAT